MTAVVRTENLTKLYRSGRGISAVTFTVQAGEVFGMLGPNGAGKTTTIRLLLDLIRPTSGALEVLGLDHRRAGVEIRRRLGYVPGDLRLYERLTAREHVRYLAHLRGMHGTGEAERLAETFELELDTAVRTMSRGARQKVGIVLAFMHRPELLVLDEPTAGLDPLMQQAFAALLRETVEDGRAVFLSSHILSEVQQVADRVAAIRDGRLALVESVDALRTRAFTRVEATFANPPPGDAFEGLAGVRVLGRHGHVVLFALQGSADPLVKALARFEVVGLDSREADLEDIFLGLYRTENDAA